MAIGKCAHAWLFPRVAAVVHHGGAGTVCAGLRAARPTMVIPFVGDQFFWGQACISKGVGPQPLAFRKLVDVSSNGDVGPNQATSNAAQDDAREDECRTEMPLGKSKVFQALVERLAKLRQGSDTWIAYQARAEQISATMLEEDGAKGAVHWFHANLPSQALQCDLLPQLPARFFLTKSGVKVSVVALLVVLAERKRLRSKKIGETGSAVSACAGDDDDVDDDKAGTAMTRDELDATTDGSETENIYDGVEVFTAVDWGTQGPKDAKQGFLSALGRPVHNILNLVPRAAASVRHSLNEAESVSDGLTRVAATAVSNTPKVALGAAQTGLGMAYDIVRGAKAAGASTRAMQPHSGLGVSQYLDEVAVKGGGHGAKGVSEVAARMLDTALAGGEGGGGASGAGEDSSDTALSSCVDLDRLERQFQMRMGLNPMVWRRGSRSSVRRHAVVASSMVNDAIHSPRSSSPQKTKTTTHKRSDVWAGKEEGYRGIIPMPLVRIVLLRYEALTLTSLGGETTENWTALPPCPPPGFSLSRAAEMAVAQAQATRNNSTTKRARATRSGSTSSVTSTGSRSRSTSLDPVRDSVSVALSRSVLPRPAPLPRPSQITAPTVRGWFYKLGTATNKSMFNMYKYTSYFWVRRFFTIRAGRLVYALAPSCRAMQSAAGPLPTDWEQHNAQVRGSFNLAEIDIRAVSEPIDLFSGERFGKNIGKGEHPAGSKAMYDAELKQTGGCWGDAFVQGYPNAHHHCIELRAFGHQELGEVLVAPSPDVRDRWLEVLLLAQRAEDYWRGVDENMSQQVAAQEVRPEATAAEATPVHSSTMHGGSEVPLAPIPSAPSAPSAPTPEAASSSASQKADTNMAQTKVMKAQKKELKKRRRALEKREIEVAELLKQRADEHEAQVAKEQRLEEELSAAKRDLEELRANKSKAESAGDQGAADKDAQDKQAAYTKMLQERLKETAAQHEAQLKETKDAAVLRESAAAAELVALKEEMQRLRGEKDFLSKHKFHAIKPSDVTLGRLNNTMKCKDVTFAAASKKQLKKCQVGSGSDKRCFEGTWNGRNVAVLRLAPGAKSAVHEADTFAALGQGHTNLITCFGFMQLEDGCEHVICELAELGTLSDVLNRYSRGRVARDVQLEILIQVCSGMECLQQLPLIHRNLAARNVMVAAFPTDDPSAPGAAQNINVKVSDFGLSKYGGSARESSSSGETKGKDKEKAEDEEARPLRYMAPETFAVPAVFSEKSDVWAFGVLVWEVLDSCKTWAPYGDVTDDDALVAGVLGGSLKLSRPKKASKALWRIAQSCLQQDPEQRPRFEDLTKTLEGLRATIQ